ncbi:iron chelate uptake ABC transporter family permease subunit [Corynebacterium sp. TAE3-ERU12]|uniref:FecCD family ABC transporter permease n=1 Tax=Corynebacterium sp. TAE3-ERU12 TaxID=2849491 RepID=UPI001C464582|nr:iron chelate uptake ABC transporter family permease subunit [Corynebacterium sp. TAE3-ERU12]MBV7294657.1 iron chelate uptake ABC transporter family permease subunit [Corynebacterium sp. TAE3-ERU12]
MTAALSATTDVRVVRMGKYSVRLHFRDVIIFWILVLLTGLLAAVSAAVGPASSGAKEFWGTVLAGGSPPDLDTVMKWRLPRIGVAVAGGALLALGGAFFQVLTRNPLGSPDIIGFNTGAYTGALLATLLMPPTGGRELRIGGITLYLGDYVPAAGAFAGGVVCAILVLGLSRARVGGTANRLVVIGIAVSATLTAANVFIIMKTDVNYASAMTSWSFGALNGMRTPDAVFVACCLGVAAVVCPWAAHVGAALRCSDDLAVAIGSSVTRHRVLFVILGVAVTAVVTSVVGPVMFIALAAPHIARGITGSPGLALGCTAVVGALLLLAADTLARLGGIELPAGVVTMILGGAYFFWLLLRLQWSR